MCGRVLTKNSLCLAVDLSRVRQFVYRCRTQLVGRVFFRKINLLALNEFLYEDNMYFISSHVYKTINQRVTSQ